MPSGIRYAEADIDLGDGLVVRAGEAIHAIWAAANVDPNAFEDPLRVDFSRGRVNHIAFASGTHRCLGSHLARLELRIALEEFSAGFPTSRSTPARPCRMTTWRSEQSLGCRSSSSPSHLLPSENLVG